MAEDRDALLQHYLESRQGLLAAIDGLDDAALSEPSLDGWSVKDHLLHVSFWDELRASEVERIAAGHEPAWPHEPDLESFGYEQRKNLSAVQAKWEMAHSRERLLDAIAKASPRGLDGSLYAEAGLRSMHEAMHTSWIQRWRQERGL